MKRWMALLLLAACSNKPAPPPFTGEGDQPQAGGEGLAAASFPAPDRPVSAIVSDTWSDEASRDSAAEADTVMRLAGIAPGQAVADIGAGSGYYAVRLAPRVGPRGRVYAQDIMPEYLAGLRKRVADLPNVTPVLGTADDPRLPAPVDRALMVHMYHEIAQPYALLWRLRASLKPGARLAIVDADRPTNAHGTPPALLRCELAAVGYAQVGFHPLGDESYLALFEARGPRPEPAAIKACSAG